MGIRSTNSIQSFFDDFFQSGDLKGAALPPLSVTGGNTSYVYNGKKIHVWTSPGPFVVTGGPNSLEYFVVGAGGAGGADMGGGGGGGGVTTGSLTLSGPFSTTVTVGPGGVAQARNSATPTAAIGNASTLPNPVSTITAFGGGYGQNNSDPDTDFAALKDTRDLGSGGGGYGQSHPSAGGPATNYPGPTQQGTPGYETAPSNYGGGGGGAGTTAPPNGFGASQQDGGYGIAIPTTFRDPSNPYGGTNGPAQPNLSLPGNWYFAGGGCGGNPVNGNAYAGGGTVANNGAASTGSGGGGGPGSGGSPGGGGGTGIVFVAYTPA